MAFFLGNVHYFFRRILRTENVKIVKKIVKIVCNVKNNELCVRELDIVLKWEK